MRSIISAIGIIAAFTLLLPVCLSGIAATNPLKSLDEARALAQKENKLIFADFTAQWCTPCRWMEQTTFSDKQVRNILARDYVHVKIDIDDVAGFELKKLYAVKFLPTMLVFNSAGQMIDRIEETVTPKVLTGILRKHKEMGSQSVIKFEPNRAPGSNFQTEQISDPAVSDPFISSDDFLRYFFHHPEMKTYRIETGTFSDFTSASAQVQLFRKKYNEPINVVNEIKDGAVVFKVQLGQFLKPEEAEQFRKKLKEELDIEALVR
jgi:thioredoxin-related protein